ncbi:hypothetical protein [Pararhizobium sp. LjRoot238]|uniref:hypothetical protein n=1 Tax=Pararhizobium sp. LjRoot238 TaxID=3342293 RepID=UPI003ED0F189
MPNTIVPAADEAMPKNESAGVSTLFLEWGREYAVANKDGFAQEGRDTACRKISRRIMLGGFAATAGGMAATAVPLPAPAAADTAPAPSPEERLQAAIEELQAAATAAIQSIVDWRLCVKPDMDGCPLLIAAFTH